MNFLKDGLSVDETKASVLVLSFVATLGFTFYQLVAFGEISDNLLTLLGYEIMAVTGVNVADKIMGKSKITPVNNEVYDDNSNYKNLP